MHTDHDRLLALEAKFDALLIVVGAGHADAIVKMFAHISNQLERIMASQADLTKQIQDLTTQVAKIGTETTTTLQMVTDLQKQVADLIAAGSVVTPELQKAVDDLAAQVKKTDDLVPDVTPTP